MNIPECKKIMNSIKKVIVEKNPTMAFVLSKLLRSYSV